MTFDELLKKWDWKPIRNCPGRFALDSSRTNLSISELLGEDVEAIEFHVERAPDTVQVVGFDGGGLISYERSDGSLFHTLNNSEGFRRKLLQLGINSR